MPDRAAPAPSPAGLPRLGAGLDREADAIAWLQTASPEDAMVFLASGVRPGEIVARHYPVARLSLRQLRILVEDPRRRALLCRNSDLTDEHVRTLVLDALAAMVDGGALVVDLINDLEDAGRASSRRGVIDGLRGWLHTAATHAPQQRNVRAADRVAIQFLALAASEATEADCRAIDEVTDGQGDVHWRLVQHPSTPVEVLERAIAKAATRGERCAMAVKMATHPRVAEVPRALATIQASGAPRATACVAPHLSAPEVADALAFFATKGAAPLEEFLAFLPPAQRRRLTSQDLLPLLEHGDAAVRLVGQALLADVTPAPEPPAPAAPVGPRRPTAGR